MRRREIEDGRYEKLRFDWLAMEERIDTLEYRLQHVPSDLRYASERADALEEELRANNVALQRRVTQLERRLLDHHLAAPVNTARGVTLYTMLDIYRGETPQGQRIHEVRRASEARTEYHVEGVAVDDESR